MLCRFVIAISLFWAASLSYAQERNADAVDKVIASLFAKQSGKFLCLSQNESHATIRTTVMNSLKGVDLKDKASQDTISKVIYTKFPCPFSPDRPELRPARIEDIKGMWLFPVASQRYRYGPQSPLWESRAGLPPIRCEAIVYGANGRMAIDQAVGSAACPTSEKMRKLEAQPKGESWSFIRDGRIRVDRTDAPNDFEEWDLFVVEKNFDFAGTTFRKGDMVEYRRREKGNEFNVATMFRHLQKMP
ncbi:hypothetical protein [Noviherbaspirillum autotrophicum]|uniref:Uncharacterized protein n=1 Tax=Noviherbaspirillum autotrophicum TaxID=709839 RepID=A0A0C2BXS8_9BURK|nr:hypothetical protein [Noviherbaspirillum autotrophicum]KIF82826.1 hypothetical protein TSA66_21570 [Noviherbaspirillum autotrophicum]